MVNMQWIKKYKNWIIGSMIILVVLTIAFLSGGTKSATSPVSGGEGTEATGQELISSSEGSTEFNSFGRRNNTREGTSTRAEESNTDKSGKNEGAATETGAGRTSEQTGSHEDPDKGSADTEKETGTTERPDGNTSDDTAVSGTEAETTENSPVTFTCTISISCASIINHMDSLDPAKAELIPEGGVILGTTSVTVTEGESVYDVLRRTCSNAGIPLDASFTPATGSAYVRGIQNIYEFDCGSLSGWKYSVNGSYSNYGCSAYILKEGDSIQWNYTCDMNNE